MRRILSEAGFLVLVGFSIVGAVALRAAAAVADVRERWEQ